jgi:uncharacterized protein YndB with AHSA1/START domain
MTDTENPILSVRRSIKCSAAKAFDAWTQPELVRQWWGAWASGEAPAMEIEPAVGAPFRFGMTLGANVQWVFGEITAVQRPSRLEFTFVFEDADAPPTPVVLEFKDSSDGTCEVSLVHDQTNGGIACEEGWAWSLDCLANFLEV